MGPTMVLYSPNALPPLEELKYLQSCRPHQMFYLFLCQINLNRRGEQNIWGKHNNVDVTAANEAKCLQLFLDLQNLRFTVSCADFPSFI